MTMEADTELCGRHSYSIRKPRGKDVSELYLELQARAMNRGKEPPMSLCERKFVLEAIKESKVRL